MRCFLYFFILLLAVLPRTQADQVFRNGDVFEMRLSGPPEEFTREFNLMLTVYNDSVNLPIIGRVRAAGLSSTQLAQVIEKRLKDEKIFTVANVNITVNANQNVQVFGNNFQGGLIVDVFNGSGTKVGTLSGSGQIQNVTATSFTMVIFLGSAAGSFGIEVVNPNGVRSSRFTFSTDLASALVW